MEKIITVNIHNKEYKITESAFQLLEDYNNFIKRNIYNTEKINDIEIQISVIIDMESEGKGKDYIVDAEVIKEVIKVLRDNQTVFYEIPVGNQTQKNTGNAGKTQKKSEFMRDIENKVIGGVCAGIAKKMNIDPVVVRVLFVILSLIFGIFFFLYIVLWIAMPEENVLVKDARYTKQKI